MRFFDWIWHIRGRLPLQPGQTSEEAIDRLIPMFEEQGTSYQRADGTLTFSKKDQAAQDQMSIFDGGVLAIEPGEPTPSLTYNLKSRALLACFIAPLIFIAFAQFSIGLSALYAGTESGDRTTERGAEDAAEEEEEEAEIRLHPIDRWLGAPEPKQPGEDEEEDTTEARAASDVRGERAATDSDAAEDDEEEEGPRHSPGPAYVFAAIFAAVYLGGRVLEDWLIKRRFRRRLFDEEPAPGSST